jgi:serine/threonine protein kinase
MATNKGLIGSTISHYKIDRLIGQGGMASVYQATDTKLERPAAIKVLHAHLAGQEQYQQRFLQEARAVAAMDHPNIVRVISFNSENGVFYMVMELIVGGNLRAYLKRLEKDHKVMEVSEAVELARQMADALSYAHQQGMVHRDIKPDNIMLKPNQSVLTQYMPILTDFGLAKMVESGDIFDTEQPAGTYPYMSPEQVRAERVDTRSDIYELGVVMYEIITGRLPYAPRSIAEALRMHTRDPLTRPSALRPIPGNLEKILLKSLEKDANERYQTAGEVSRALQDVQMQMANAENQALVLDTDVDTAATKLMQTPIAPTMPTDAAPPLPPDQALYDRMVIFSDAYPARTIAITKPLTTVGRDDDRDIVLESRTVSRKHARIERDQNGTYRLIDLGSTNGTWLNDKMMMSNIPQALDVGNVVRLGEYWLRLEAGQPNQPMYPPMPMYAPQYPQPQDPSDMGTGDYPPPNYSYPPADPNYGYAPPAYGGAPAYGQPYPQAYPAYPQSPYNPPTAPLTDLEPSQGGQAQGLGAYQPQYTMPRQADVQHIELKAEDRDKLELTLNTTYIPVAAGSRVAVSLEVVNQSTLVDHFTVSVVGLPADWYTLPSNSLYLLPRDRDTASIMLHPPLRSTSSAGQHAFEVRITAQAQRIASVAKQAALDVAPFRTFTSDLQPPRVRNRGVIEVAVTNTGNIANTFTLVPRDREGQLKFELAGKQYKVLAGNTEYIALKVAARNRPFIGSSSSVPYQVTLVPNDAATGTDVQNGEVYVTPRFPIWIIPLLLFACILCLLLSLLTLFQINNTNIANATATSSINATATTDTVTLVAGQDADGDGLFNYIEERLLTDPNKFDTDEDGLSDGLEVNRYGTDPRKRDTDGDQLSDGDEINSTGTDPLKVDTDLDGIPDGSDIAPLLIPTLPPTPFPTLPGTAGEICPGSPPTRMAVGINGRVEPGGVPNRIRPEPSLGEDQIGKMAPEEPFIVIGGPTCDEENQIRWWQINYNGLIGWTAEGVGDEYYIAPVDAPPPTVAPTAAG